MATAEKSTREVQRTVSETEDVIVLTLSGDEAAALLMVVGSVGGQADAGPRKHTGAVYGALKTAGVPAKYNGNPFRDLLTGTLHSKAGPEPVKPAPLAVGDRIRILRDFYDCAGVERGEVLTVDGVDSEGFSTGIWGFPLDGEGDGWERVTEPAGLKAGDTLRITRDEPLPHGYDRAELYVNDRVTVVVAEPDYDGDIEVRTPAGRTWYLKASGSDKGWEVLRTRD